MRNSKTYEVNTDRAQIVLLKAIILHSYIELQWNLESYGEADQEAGLANARVPNQHQLKQVVATE